MFIVLYWLEIYDVAIVLNEDGLTKLFKTHAEAESFAELELAANWQIVEL